MKGSLIKIKDAGQDSTTVPAGGNSHLEPLIEHMESKSLCMRNYEDIETLLWHNEQNIVHACVDMPWR